MAMMDQLGGTDEPMAPDEVMPPAEAEAPDDGSYDIVLTVLADGTFQVAKESGEEPDADETEMGPMAGEPHEEVESYDSFEEALKAVLQMYRGNPIGGTAMDHMRAGYGKEEGL